MDAGPDRLGLHWAVTGDTERLQGFTVSQTLTFLVGCDGTKLCPRFP